MDEPLNANPPISPEGEPETGDPPRAATDVSEPTATDEDSAVELTDAHFQPQAEAEVPAVRPPGPGLPEAVLWIVGFYVVMIGANVVVAGVMLLLHGMHNGWDSLSVLVHNPRELTRSLSGQKAALIAGIEGIVVAVSLPAVLLRLGRGVGRKLPLRPIPLHHAAMLFFLFPVVILLDSQLAAHATWVWRRIVELLPALKGLESMGSMETVKPLAEQAGLPLLLTAIAAAPALAEELVFRGLIGRGLVARWGVRGGVAITSLLFAAVHLSPVQAAALLPLAVSIHLSYLSTRSLWAPLLLHFSNNAFAVVMLKLVVAVRPEALSQQSDPPLVPELLLAAGLCVGCLLTLMWQTRIRYRLPDGSLWDPGYPTTDLPPESADARSVWKKPSAVMLAAAVGSFFVLAIAFVVAIVRIGLQMTNLPA